VPAAVTGPFSNGPYSCSSHVGTMLTMSSDSPHRRPLRLPEYDCSQPGAYFVTVCTRDRECILGEVVDASFRPNEMGTMVEHTLLWLTRQFPTIQLDAHSVMPNHLHCILLLSATCDPVCSNRAQASRTTGWRLQDAFRSSNGHSERHSSKTPLATRLLRAHHPRRWFAGPHPRLYRRKSCELGTGPGEPQHLISFTTPCSALRHRAMDGIAPPPPRCAPNPPVCRHPVGAVRERHDGHEQPRLNSAISRGSTRRQAASMPSAVC